MGLGVCGYFDSSTSLLMDFLNHLGEISLQTSFLGVGRGSKIQRVCRTLKRLDWSGLRRGGRVTGSVEMIWGFPEVIVWQNRFRNVHNYICCINVLLQNIWFGVGFSVLYRWMDLIPFSGIYCIHISVTDFLYPLIHMHSHRGWRLSHQTLDAGGHCWYAASPSQS